MRSREKLENILKDPNKIPSKKGKIIYRQELHAREFLSYLRQRLSRARAAQTYDREGGDGGARVRKREREGELKQAHKHTQAKRQGARDRAEPREEGFTSEENRLND